MKKNSTTIRNAYGLIGYPLSHSFSQKYFTEKFLKKGYKNCSYTNFPITDINELQHLLKHCPDLRGLNVTIPYKEQIISFINEMDAVAIEAGAVNTVRIIRNGENIYLKGYNTDVYGFSRSLEEWFATLEADLPQKAMILGTGGAAKAVACALHRLGVTTSIVSRKKNKTYEHLNADDIAAHPLIVNATPLGMFPKTNECPAIPYQHLTEKHYLYDLVYNPQETLFMQKGLANGASALNGARMLHLQADRAWEIWSDETEI